MASSFLRLAMLTSLATGLACTTTQEVVIGYAAAGATCTLVSDCQAGLTCKNKVCTVLPPLGDGHGRGEACDDSNPCDSGLYCGSQSLCTIAPPQALNGACVLREDCQAGLVCSYAGVCSTPDPNGAVGLQDPNSTVDCTNTSCQRPFVCGYDKRCTTLPVSGGVDCSLSDLEFGDFRFYFEVPKPLDANVEFFRLPYPNDIRKTASNQVDLSGFYSPGSILNIDVSDDYLGSVAAQVGGFPINGPVFIRASGHFDLSTVCLSVNSTYPTIPAADQIDGLAVEAFDPNCTQSTLMLVNVDPNYAASTDSAKHSQYGQAVPVEMQYGRAAGHYICQNWIGVAPRAGAPLNPNTTYALLVTNSIKSTWAATPIRDPDFEAMLEATAPSDPNNMRPELQNAYATMAPLRSFLATQSQAFANSVVGGSVFTTDAPTRMAPIMHDVVYDQNAPTFDANTTTVCDGAHISPCDDGFPLVAPTGAIHQHLRGCPAVDANYYVIQGRYGPNPVMQDGNRPYATAADGGGLVLDANGVPQPQNTESMCYALSVPKGKTMPPGGWPVVIYAHGTGGAFDTFLADGTSTIFGHDFAIISFDNVLHGWRQGNDPNKWSADAEVPLLFFNIGNAKASRDNIWQGTADLHTITRLVATQSVTTSDSSIPLVQFDPNNIYYVGHSQGTVIAPPYLVTDNTIQGAILAGAGAELPLSLLTKTQPINVTQLLGIFFGDKSVARVHPMMGMMAALFGGVDAIGYAGMLANSPYVHTRTGACPNNISSGQTCLPTFEVMGLLDSYCPDATQQALARAAGFPLTNGPLESYDGMIVTLPPVYVDDGTAQYNSNGNYDGHFVMFQNPLAEAAVSNFLKSIVAGDPKIIPQ